MFTGGKAMTKLLAGVASVSLLAALSLSSPAAATERPDGIRSDKARPADFSAVLRRYHRRRVVIVRRYVRPYYYGGYYPYRYYGGYYPYYSGYPYYYGGPSLTIGFGFGRRWWW